LKETITTSAEAEGRFIRQTSGRNLYAIVRLKVEPLGRGKGIVFANALAEGVLPQEYIKPIEEGVRESAENGVVRGFPMTDLRVTLLGGSYHEVDSSAMAFKTAGAMGFKEAARRAKPVIFEPGTD
jgi:elongation factor G